MKKNRPRIWLKSCLDSELVNMNLAFACKPALLTLTLHQRHNSLAEASPRRVVQSAASVNSHVLPLVCFTIIKQGQIFAVLLCFWQERCTDYNAVKSRIDTDSHSFDSRKSWAIRSFVRLRRSTALPPRTTRNVSTIKAEELRRSVHLSGSGADWHCSRVGSAACRGRDSIACSAASSRPQCVEPGAALR